MRCIMLTSSMYFRLWHTQACPSDVFKGISTTGECGDTTATRRETMLHQTTLIHLVTLSFYGPN